MANLRVNKITGTEVFETTGSVQFDGVNDYLTIPDSSDFTFGSGDFTLEAWIYIQSYGNYPSIINKYETGGSGAQWFWSLDDNSPGQSFYFYVGSDVIQLRNVGNIPLNQWTHCAVTRNGETIRIFQDGILQGNFSVGTSSMNDTSGAVSIGADALGLYDFRGHISNARIIKGTALYTKNFTPPTRELTVTPETVLLACQHKTDASHEKTGKTITVNGNAVANELTPGLLTDVVKSGGSSAITGSVEFDGTGDYLQLADSDDWDVTGDYTIEFWAKLNVSDASYTDVILATGTLAGSTGFQIGIYDKDLLVRVNSTQYYTASVGRMSYDGWSHIAVVWNGSSFKVYLNGIQIHSGTTETTSTSTSLIIGNQTDLDSNRYFNGFISNLRIVKGTALYTANFIPPTRELKKVPGTVLLCCQDSTNPLQEATGKTITGFGDLQKADGVELVTNGTFDTATTGWTAASNTSISIDTARLKVTNDSTVYGSSYQDVTVVIGKIYRIEVDVISGTGSGNYHVGTTSVSNAYVSAATTPSYVVPTQTTMRIVLNVGTNTSGHYYLFDNVSVTLAETRNGASKFTPSVGFDGTVTFDGITKINSPNYFYLPTGNTEDRGRGRGVFGGGYVPGTSQNTIQFINIQSQGNAQDFGDLSSNMGSADGKAPCAAASATRALFASGYSAPGPVNTIEYVTISTTSNSTDFGDLATNRRDLGACSSSTRALFGGGTTTGSTSATNAVDYITIASLGNTVSFGTLTQARRGVGSCSSSTRGIWGGGYVSNSPATFTNRIDYVTIATTGNATTFGDLTVVRGSTTSCSSSTRGLFAGGSIYVAPASTFYNTIDYITIASTGNATDFGDLSSTRSILGSCSNSTRGVFGGGGNPTMINTMEFVLIASTGNATDFGDLLSAALYYNGGCSDSHGGLG